MSYDVIVVGSGLSGSVCALKCALNGQKVLMIEKLKRLGGSSALSNLKMAVCNSQMQKIANIKDSPEIFLNDIQRLTNGMNHTELTKMLAQYSGVALEFLLQNGAEFKDMLTLQDGHSVARTLTPKNGHLSVLTPLHKRLFDIKNCDILTQHELINLNTNGDKAVALIKDIKADVIYEIKPNLAIVFATGGYSQDTAFRTIQNPLTKTIKSKTSIGANAKSLKILMKNQAMTTLLCQMRYAFDFPLEILKYSIIIDSVNQKRFLNENLKRQELAIAILSKMKELDTNLFPIAIFDSNGIDNFDNPNDFSLLLKRGEIKKFNSLKELFR